MTDCNHSLGVSCECFSHCHGLRTALCDLVTVDHKTPKHLSDSSLPQTPVSSTHSGQSDLPKQILRTSKNSLLQKGNKKTGSQWSKFNSSRTLEIHPRLAVIWEVCIQCQRLSLGKNSELCEVSLALFHLPTSMPRLCSMLSIVPTRGTLTPTD